MVEYYITPQDRLVFNSQGLKWQHNIPEERRWVNILAFKFVEDRNAVQKIEDNREFIFGTKEDASIEYDRAKGAFVLNTKDNVPVEIPMVRTENIYTRSRSANAIIWTDGTTIYADGSTELIDSKSKGSSPTSPGGDASVIQSGIDDIGDGKLYVNPKAYYLDTKLTLCKGLNFEGGGKSGGQPLNTVLLPADTLSDDILYFSGDNNPAMILLRDFGIDGNNIATNCIHIIDGYDTYLHNVFPQRATNHGIYGESTSWGFIMTDVLSEHNGGDGAHFIASGALKIQGCKLNGNTGYGLWTTSDRVHVSATELRTNDKDGARIYSDYCMVECCTLYTNGPNGEDSQIFIAGKGNKIVGCNIDADGKTSYCINIWKTSTDTVIDSNTIKNYTTQAIKDDGFRTRVNGLGTGKGDPSATIDSGTAESGTGDSLTDSDKAWSADQYNGYMVRITGGTGSGQERHISDTTSDTLTVDTNWDTNPDSTSDYEIVNEWNGYGEEGIEVVDTTTGITYKYINDKWRAENSGKETFSGDGTTTSFSWAHGFSSTPTSVTVTPGSADANGDYHATADATDITITFASAPADGTDNVVLWWYAEL